MRNLLVFIIFLSPLCLMGQIPVTDGASLAALEQLNAQFSVGQFQNKAEFIQQTAALKNTLQFMKDTKEKLSKINAKISTIIQFNEMLKTQIEIIKRQSDYINKISNDNKLTAKEVQAVNARFASILRRTERLLNLGKELFTNDSYEMNDAERINAILEVSNGLDSLLMEVVTLESRTEYLRKERSLEYILRGW